MEVHFSSVTSHMRNTLHHPTHPALTPEGWKAELTCMIGIGCAAWWFTCYL